MKEPKYEILCNAGNNDYYYTYLTKNEVKDLETATNKVMDLERRILERTKKERERKEKIQGKVYKTNFEIQ